VKKSNATSVVKTDMQAPTRGPRQKASANPPASHQTTITCFQEEPTVNPTDSPAIKTPSPILTECTSSPSDPGANLSEIVEPCGGPPGKLESVLIPEIPDILHDFKDKKWKLLWRGSGRGYDARTFHMLTVIVADSGDVFGGFTPVVWGPMWNADFTRYDGRVKSFLFRLKNTHGIPARKFALKGEQSHRPIHYNLWRGPSFGDITVSDNCNMSLRKLHSPWRVLRQ
jgi:hypothetical protein